MIIQNFKNRERELKELDSYLESDTFELIIIYGRRRIGKTELVLKATQKKERIYYLAVGRRNLERFYNTCVQHYPESSRLKPDWEVLFEFLKTRADVVIIDEFQNLIQEDSHILHIFQSVTDIILKGSTLTVILVGSSISMMTSKILDYKSPLYGRKTGSLELRAVPFFELTRFFPHADIEELVEIYGFADGIPFYLVQIDKEFWQWLQEELMRERFLRDEVDFLMKYEFRDVGTYTLILEAIAHGKTKVNEIKDFIKVKRTDISPYIRNLTEVKMVERVVPLFDNIKSRRGQYYLCDNFLTFWFRYIYPNVSSIEEGIFDIAIIREDYSRYLGPIFEDVCKQFLIKNVENFFSFTKIGKWWYKDKEIDLIAVNRRTKDILFAECKWRDNVDAEKVFSGLEEKSRYVDWFKKSCRPHFAVFAKSFSTKSGNCMCFDLKDLERIA